MYSKRSVLQDLSMMVSFSFFMLKRRRSLTARYFSDSGRKLRLVQLRMNWSRSCRSQASMREMSSWTSFSFLKGMEASWQRALQRASLRSAGFQMSRLTRTLVLRISLSSAELPYLAFSRNASATQRALFSKLQLRNMPSAMASFRTEMWPSLIQASASRVGILSSISRSFSPISLPVSLLCLISRLQSSSSTGAGAPSSSLPSISSNSASASFRSFSSMAFSSSIRYDLTRICASREAMKSSRSGRMLAQSEALRMATMARMEFSVYFSWVLSCAMREMVVLRASRRRFLLQICRSWLRILTLQFLRECSSAVAQSASSSSTAFSHLPSRMSPSISKYSSSTRVSTFSSPSSSWGSSYWYSSSQSQSDIYLEARMRLYIVD